jgi:hypothetical protein
MPQPTHPGAIEIVADQKQTPNNDSVNPLFNKMDALMARHRNGPAASLDDIPVLTEVAPKTIPSLFDVVDDIPSLTDVVEPNLADKIASLELEWAIDHHEPDIGHLDDEIIAPAPKAKPASLTIDPLPFKQSAEELKPAAAAVMAEPDLPPKVNARISHEEALVIPLMPDTPMRKPVAAVEPAFLDLPMLDLDELTREPEPDFLDLPTLANTSKLDPVNSHPVSEFLATDLVLELDNLPADESPSADFASVLAETSLAAAEVPHLDLEAILPSSVAESTLHDSITQQVQDIEDDSRQEEIITSANLTTAGNTDETATNEAKPSSLHSQPTDIVEPISHDLEALVDPRAQITAQTSSKATTDNPEHTGNSASLSDEATPSSIITEGQLAPLTQIQPQDMITETAITAPSLSWDDEVELIVYSGSLVENVAIDLDTLSPIEPTTEPFEPADTTAETIEESTQGIAPESTLEEAYSNIPTDSADIIPEAEALATAKQSAAIIAFPLHLTAPPAVTDKIPPQSLSEDSVEEITAIVGAQLAIDIASEVEQLTKQHFSALMNQLYGETLRKLTEEISRDLEAHLAPRIAELVEAELRSKGLL